MVTGKMRMSSYGFVATVIPLRLKLLAVFCKLQVFGEAGKRGYMSDMWRTSMHDALLQPATIVSRGLVAVYHTSWRAHALAPSNALITRIRAHIYNASVHIYNSNSFSFYTKWRINAEPRTCQGRTIGTRARRWVHGGGRDNKQ